MSTRLRLAPALLVALLGLALALHMAPSGGIDGQPRADEPRERRGWRGDPTLVSTADTPLGFRRGIRMEDPDGHGIHLRARE
jgi:hypothetical protein